MSENELTYSIRFDLPAQPERPASVGAKFVDTLDALAGVDSIFVDWRVFDFSRRSYHPLAETRQRIAAIIERNVVRNDLGVPSPDEGYCASARAGKFKHPRSTELTVDAGGKFKSGALLEFGGWRVAPDPAIVTHRLFKAALLAITAVWRATWASAYAFTMDYDRKPLFPGVPLFPYSIFHIPWIAYLSAPLAAGVELPPEILTERTPDGGLLMSVTNDRLDPTNPEHVRRARILAETMIARTAGLKI